MASVRVEMVVEIEISDQWSDDTTIAQVQAQAIESARAALRNGLILDYGQSGRDPKTRGRIIGEPRIRTIIHANAAVTVSP